MVRWKPAPCGVTLSEQLDDMYGAERPNDGTIGDTAHSNRTSDHNPQPPDGWVDARDVYDWGGLNADTLMHRLAASRDRRILYVISHGRMCSSYPAARYVAWQWRPYSGLNGHFSHGHISFRDEYRHDTSPWAITQTIHARPAPDLPEDDVTPQDIEAVAQRVVVLLGQEPGRMPLADRLDEIRVAVRDTEDGPMERLIRRVVGLPKGRPPLIDLIDEVRRAVRKESQA